MRCLLPSIHRLLVVYPRLVQEHIQYGHVCDMASLLEFSPDLCPERGRWNIESIQGADLWCRAVEVSIEGARPGTGLGERRGNDAALREACGDCCHGGRLIFWAVVMMMMMMMSNARLARPVGQGRLGRLDSVTASLFRSVYACSQLNANKAGRRGGRAARGSSTAGRRVEDPRTHSEQSTMLSTCFPSSSHNTTPRLLPPPS